MNMSYRNVISMKEYRYSHEPKVSWMMNIALLMIYSAHWTPVQEMQWKNVFTYQYDCFAATLHCTLGIHSTSLHCMYSKVIGKLYCQSLRAEQHGRY